MDDSNDCTEDTCDDAGQPVNRDLAAGATCATGVCDGDGACVECVDDDDCTGGETCDTASNTCGTPTCTDGDQNGDETDIDCGGSCAPGRRCADGDGCQIGGDCTSGVCGAGDTCAAPSCGDGVRQGNEACDDGNNTNGDGCDDGAGDACRPTGCGNGVVAGTEECDDMNNTNGDGCDNNCTDTGCGNGIITTGETCDDDDADAGDGCSATCATEAGYTCTGLPSVCVATCGDGIVAATEACDDPAPAESGDGCSITCTVEPGYGCTGSPSVCAGVCGDGVRTATEGCDDGDASPGDGCNANCFVEPGYVCAGTPSACFPICGDNQVVGGEPCDDPAPAENGDGCSATCRVEAGFICTGSPSVCTAFCGDGIVLTGEPCDDAPPTENGDGCSATCTVEPGWTCAGSPSLCNSTCGDGIPVGLETCDDDDTDPGDGCSATCTVESGFLCTGAPSSCAPVCGDGLVRTGEACDDAPPTENGDGCSTTCTIEPGWVCLGEPSACAFTCGNGTLEIGETCDDGALLDGDGCSAACATETGWTCTGSPSACTAVCGDGLVRGTEACDDPPPLENGDGCSATCTVEPGWSCAGSPSVCDGTCGDGTLHGTEECEDGDAPPAGGDGCDTTCHVEPGYECSGVPSVCVPVCGDGVETAPEECDDGNQLAIDGCSPTCRDERTEVEPNEDGAVEPFAFGTDGNDFDDGGIAPGNADAQGIFDVVDGDDAIIGAMPVSGDEDVYTLINSTALPYSVRLDVWNTDAGFGVNVPCGTSIDLAINIRQFDSTLLKVNDDRAGFLDRCPGMDVTLLPGETVYVHVVVFDDTEIVAGYGLQFRPTAIVCGNGVVTPGAEECDDGNTIDTDECSNTCLLDAIDEVEPNDDTAQADANGLLITDNTLVRAANPSSFDIDVFRIDVPAFSVLRIESFTGAPGFCNNFMFIGLFDSNGVGITTDFDTSGIGDCSAIVFPADPGTYYVEVQSFDVIPAYFLEVEFTTTSGAEGEPPGTTGFNDDDTTAEVSLLNATDHWVSGDHSIFNDFDVYAITIPPGKALRAEIVEGDLAVENCESFDLDSRLTLFEDGVQLVDDDDSGRAFCSMIDGTGGIAARNPEAQNNGTTPVTWHLHVYQSSFASPSGGDFQYRLQITVR